jgi:hypothetical protein
MINSCNITPETARRVREQQCINKLLEQHPCGPRNLDCVYNHPNRTAHSPLGIQGAIQVEIILYPFEFRNFEVIKKLSDFIIDLPGPRQDADLIIDKVFSLIRSP